MKHHHLIKITQFFFFTIIVVFILGEIGTQIYIRYFANYENFIKFASIHQLVKKLESTEEDLQVKVHPYLGYALKENFKRGKNCHNSMGFRGKELTPKKEGEIWIACIGGSTTYDDEIEDWEKAYPAQLENILQNQGYKVQVINAGTPGWTSWEILVDYLFRLSYLPIDILIYYEASNELSARIVYPPSAYKPDNTGTRSGLPGIFKIPIWEESALIRMILISTGYTLPHLSILRIFDRPAYTNYALDFGQQNFNGNYPDGIFKTVSLEEILQANPPIYFEQNLKHLVLLAKNKGVQPVLVSFALDHSPNALKRLYGVGDDKPELVKTIFAAYDEMNDVTKEVATESGTPFFNFAQEYPNDPNLYVDSLHNNEEGARLKAQMFADFLIHSGLLSK